MADQRGGNAGIRYQAVEADVVGDFATGTVGKQDQARCMAELARNGEIAFDQGSLDAISFQS